MATLLQDIY